MYQFRFQAVHRVLFQKLTAAKWAVIFQLHSPLSVCQPCLIRFLCTYRLHLHYKLQGVSHQLVYPPSASSHPASLRISSSVAMAAWIAVAWLSYVEHIPNSFRWVCMRQGSAVTLLVLPMLHCSLSSLQLDKSQWKYVNSHSQLIVQPEGGRFSYTNWSQAYNSHRISGAANQMLSSPFCL